MTVSDMNAWLDRYKQAWERRDPELAASLFSEEAQYFETPFGPPAQGKPGILAYWSAATQHQRDVAFSYDIVSVANDVGVARWSAEYTHASSETRRHLEGVFVLEFDNHGLCKSLREWWHRKELVTSSKGINASFCKPLVLVPMMYVQNVPRSIEFYGRLGFEAKNTHKPDSEPEAVWAWLQSAAAQLMVAKATQRVDPEKQASLFYVYVPDVAAFRAELMKRELQPGDIQHPFYAPRGEFRLTDPDGYTLMISHT